VTTALVAQYGGLRSEQLQARLMATGEPPRPPTSSDSTPTRGDDSPRVAPSQPRRLCRDEQASLGGKQVERRDKITAEQSQRPTCAPERRRHDVWIGVTVTE